MGQLFARKDRRRNDDHSGNEHDAPEKAGTVLGHFQGV
jgi:hypothetical protein